ncbi:MAG: transposase [Bacteroidia bacterium]
MTDLFRNKYRIQTARAEWWNYGLNRAYFITICTKDKECFFGKINNFKTILSPIGELAHKFWLEIPEHFSFVKLEEFVIMPNHVHGIIIIEKDDSEIKLSDKGRFQNQGKNTISSIIGSYKSVVTKYARVIDSSFAWQARFYDVIVKDEISYNNIRQYILENSEKWQNDEYNVNK